MIERRGLGRVFDGQADALGLALPTGCGRSDLHDVFSERDTERRRAAVQRT